MPTSRTSQHRPEQNEEQLRTNLDLLNEVREASQIRLAAYQQRVRRYYNSRVKERRFRAGDMVLKKVSTKDKITAFSPNWEGPYRVLSSRRLGTYWLEDMDGRALSHPWNAEHLKIYYP